MKHKIRAKVLSKKKKKNCYFCGKPALSRHHIIPRRIGGKGLKNNQVDICDNCHKKLHFILDPPIDYLLAIIQRLGKLDKPKMKKTRKIGFIINKKEDSGNEK